MPQVYQQESCLCICDAIILLVLVLIVIILIIDTVWDASGSSCLHCLDLLPGCKTALDARSHLGIRLAALVTDCLLKGTALALLLISACNCA